MHRSPGAQDTIAVDFGHLWTLVNDNVSNTLFFFLQEYELRDREDTNAHRLYIYIYIYISVYLSYFLL